jgi:hypothetical protein
MSAMADQSPIGRLTFVNERRRLIAKGMSMGTVSQATPVLTRHSPDVISVWPKQEINLGCRQLRQYAVF